MQTPWVMFSLLDILQLKYCDVKLTIFMYYDVKLIHLIKGYEKEEKKENKDVCLINICTIHSCHEIRKI